jgi:cytochrome bd-type quinol oxidase subunit 2
MDAKKVQAKQYIREHPGFFAWVTARHVLNIWTCFWSLDRKFLDGEPFHIPNAFFASALTLLMIGGLRCAWLAGKGEAVLPLLIILLTFPLVYYITHSSMDYRHPIDPIIVIVDCYCVLEWRRRRAATKA